MIAIKKFTLAAAFAAATTTALVLGSAVTASQVGTANSFVTAAFAADGSSICQYKKEAVRDACLSAHRKSAMRHEEGDVACSYETKGDVALESKRQACLASHRHYNGDRERNESVCSYETKGDVALEVKREACLRAHHLPITKSY
jgi:hypothetical protein